MKSLVSFLVVAVICALSGSCAAKDPDLRGATQAFQKRYLEYVIRSSRVEDTREGRKVVVVEFAAPNNAEHRGGAELLTEKATNSSWAIVSEKVNMWKR